MSLILLASGAVLTASFFFGGGAHRHVSDLVPVLLACGLILLCLPSVLPRLREDGLLRAVLAGALIVLVLQFAPMPPSLWSALPGRGELLEMYAQSGVSPPWASLALRPGEAARSALAVLPGIALFLAVIGLDSNQRQKLVYIVIGAALVNMPLGMLQVLGGQESPLYFFDVTNLGSAVGVFANRNHYAAFFFCALPFVAAVFAGRKQISGAPLWMLGALMAFVMILGLSISGSRSALILGAAAIAASALFVARTEIREMMRGRLALVGAGLAVVLVIPLSLGVGLLAILKRFEAQDLAGDGRVTFAKVTLDAIAAFFPFGAGLGSFQQIYQLREPVTAVIEPIVNHAHNDWLEVALELGLPGLALGVAFMAWVALTVMRTIWLTDLDGRLARAALVAIALLAVHSIWDYPLRTIALSAVFGLCCGLTFRPGVSQVAQVRPSRRRRRKKSSRRASTPAVT